MVRFLTTILLEPGFHTRVLALWRMTMSERELNEPHKGDKRYQRRNDDGTFGESDDQSKSLSQDAHQHAKAKKPRNQGDRGD